MNLSEAKSSAPPGLGRWAPLIEENDDDDEHLPVAEYPCIDILKDNAVKPKMPKFEKPKTNKRKSGKTIETIGEEDEGDKYGDFVDCGMSMMEKFRRAGDCELHRARKGVRDESSAPSRALADKAALLKFHDDLQVKVGGTCCPLIAEMPHQDHGSQGAELHPCTQEQWKYTDAASGWTRIRAVVDSGASDSCSPDEMAPEIKSRESTGSRRGLVYNGAAQGGRPLTNDGEKDVMMMTEDGRMLATCWQTVEVARPLLSVRQIAQQGNRVTFGAIGGEIYNLRTGKIVKFGMEGNVYVLDLWVPPSSGFIRPGR